MVPLLRSLLLSYALASVKAYIQTTSVFEGSVPASSTTQFYISGNGNGAHSGAQRICFV